MRCAVCVATCSEVGLEAAERVDVNLTQLKTARERRSGERRCTRNQAVAGQWQCERAVSGVRRLMSDCHSATRLSV